ncbi:hypothetical protein D5086_017726 [Populus alba]|uniref:Uncharacterized protein n=1 Tax=Populus alba TaxID=43335 RepID=A0ACC4BPB1_POPAL
MSSGPTGMDGICQWVRGCCRDPEVYLLRRKMDKRRKRATRFYSHVTHSIHRPNPTPCASAEMGFCPLLLNGYNFTFLKCFCLLLSVTSGLIDYVPAEEDDYDPGEGEGDDQT